MKIYNNPKRKVVDAKKYMEDVTTLCNTINELDDEIERLREQNLNYAKGLAKLAKEKEDRQVRRN